MISIPLAMLTSLVVLYFLGEGRSNTMTLGGRRAGGRHPCHRRFDGHDREHLPQLLDEEKMPLPKATLHGAAEDNDDPTLVSYVGDPVAYSPRSSSSKGWAKYLFTPLGLAVVFADAGFSMGCSRTLTPITIGQMWLKGLKHNGEPTGNAGNCLFSPVSTHVWFEHGFWSGVAESYVELLRMLAEPTGLLFRSPPPSFWRLAL